MVQGFLLHENIVRYRGSSLCPVSVLVGFIRWLCLWIRRLQVGRVKSLGVCGSSSFKITSRRQTTLGIAHHLTVRRIKESLAHMYHFFSRGLGFGVGGLGFGVWGLGFGRSEERRVGKE